VRRNGSAGFVIVARGIDATEDMRADVGVAVTARR
jgi:hypothetical protein